MLKNNTEMRFILPLPPPINQTYGVNRSGKFPFYKKTKVRDWEKEAGQMINIQWVGKRNIDNVSPVKLIVIWYFKNNRDIDAGLKSLLDLLQKQYLYKNDTQVYELLVYKNKDLENPRCEVEIIYESK